MAESIILTRRRLVAGVASIPVAAWATTAFASAKADRIMVQGRPQDTGSLYKVRNIMPALDQLGGVRKMRCREPFSGTVGWKTYVDLAKQGVRFCFTLTIRDVNKTVADLNAFLRAAPNSIFALEYPNEPDLNPVNYKGVRDRRLGFRTGDAPAFMAYVRDVNTALRSSPALRSIPLVASNDYMQAQQAPYCQFGNSHIYPRPKSCATNLLTEFRKKLAAGRHRQGFITEWGRTTGGGPKNFTSPPVSLADQAKLLSSDVAKVLAEPYVHTLSLYELFSWGGASEMNNFGLFNADLSPRPVVPAIRAVLA